MTKSKVNGRASQRAGRKGRAAKHNTVTVDLAPDVWAELRKIPKEKRGQVVNEALRELVNSDGTIDLPLKLDCGTWAMLLAVSVSKGEPIEAVGAELLGNETINAFNSL